MPMRCCLLVCLCLCLIAKPRAVQTLPLWQGDLSGLTASAAGLSPNGRWIAAGTEEGITRVFDMTNNAIRYTLGGHTQGIDWLTFTPDSGTLITAAYAERSIRFWNLSNGSLRGTINVVGANLGTLGINPDTGQLFGVLVNGTGFVWKISDRSLQRTMTDLFIGPGAITNLSLDFSSNGDNFLLGFGTTSGSSRAGWAYLYDWATGIPYREYNAYLEVAGNSIIRAVALSGTKYVFTGGDHMLTWDYGTATLTNTNSQDADQLFANSDGSKLYLAVNGDTTHELHGITRTGSHLGGFPFGSALSIGPNSSRDRFAVGCGETLELWPNRGIRLMEFASVPTLGLETAVRWGTLDYSSKFDLALYRDGQWLRDLRTGQSTSGGTWTWLVNGIAPNDGYSVRLATQDGQFIQSSASFSIQSRTGFPYVQALDPAVATTWKVGETHRIAWQEVNLFGDSVNLKLFQDRVWIKNLANYVAPGQQYFDWTVDVVPGLYQVQINASNTAEVSDATATIRIDPAPLKNGVADWQCY